MGAAGEVMAAFYLFETWRELPSDLAVVWGFELEVQPENRFMA
jgi:hypothetical protein